MQIKGHVHFNSSTNVFDLTVWVEDAGAIVIAGLGVMAYQLYDRDGILIAAVGASATGIVPLANGIYTSADVVNPTFMTNRESFLVRVSMTVGVTPLSTYLPFTIVNI